MQKFSKKLNVQLIAEVFKAFGIEHIVLSPGSRNGALATHFTWHPDFKTYSIVDERSAGFVALGMAQQLRKPVVVCCTSGSALVNYYPAVTEAFYQNVPIIVLSADRPEYLVDNFDGQTIRQKNVLDLHSFLSIQLTEDESTQSLTDNLGLIKKAILTSLKNSGPIHINMPFSEPLYEFQETIDLHFDQFDLSSLDQKSDEIDYEKLVHKWNMSKRKLILVGMQFPDEELNNWIGKIADDDSVVVLTETTSNLHNERFINKIDAAIFTLEEHTFENLKPEILLTIGQNVVSKKVKSFLRNHKPKEHWHVDKYWQPDTYQCLTERIKSMPLDFLKVFVPKIYQQESNYYSEWNSIRKEKEKNQSDYLMNTPFSDLKVFQMLIATFPKEAEIHYGNSSAIRYAQLFDHNSSNVIFSNRGTSGIDGCTSTAAGASLIHDKETILITGDISFFYDSNGLWNSYLKGNFKIILINNGGGNIFKIIPGPENSGVVESVFETKHHLTAEYLAKMFDFDYTFAENEIELEKILATFYSASNRPKILEINTSKVENATIQRNYFQRT